MKRMQQLVAGFLLATMSVTINAADGSLPIADAHVHYSHDSVELTPPERVIELMRAVRTDVVVRPAPGLRMMQR